MRVKFLAEEKQQEPLTLELTRPLIKNRCADQ